MQNKPVLLLEALNPHLFNYLKEIRTIKALRQELLLMKPYLLNCHDAAQLRLFSLLVDHPHFWDSADAYSLQDLIDLNSGKLEIRLRSVVQTYAKHIRQECEACRGNGYLCEFCNQNEILFPFDDYVVTCRKCRAVYHRICHEKHDGQCPRCFRRNERTSVDVV
uniref:Rubicon Homology domain-containing protein n=1 Tax=Romanomermis culicivorax TaxID=13658 RepID=A0A915KQQ8_ROMCU